MRKEKLTFMPERKRESFRSESKKKKKPSKKKTFCIDPPVEQRKKGDEHLTSRKGKN